MQNTDYMCLSIRKILIIDTKYVHGDKRSYAMLQQNTHLLSNHPKSNPVGQKEVRIQIPREAENNGDVATVSEDLSEGPRYPRPQGEGRFRKSSSRYESRGDHVSNCMDRGRYRCDDGENGDVGPTNNKTQSRNRSLQAAKNIAGKWTHCTIYATTDGDSL